jgi:hypothetical protein
MQICRLILPRGVGNDFTEEERKRFPLNLGWFELSHTVLVLTGL